MRINNILQAAASALLLVPSVAGIELDINSVGT